MKQVRQDTTKTHTFKQSPPALLMRALWLLLCGRVHFPINHVGQVKQEEEEFVVFRQAIVGPLKVQQQGPGAILKVQFSFKSFSLKWNKILSLIPIPFIIAQRGFRSKTWLYGKDTGVFQGLYEWDRDKDARNYESSFPMQLMKKRAIPESLVFEICSSEDFVE
ncbi:hypothetical protein ACFL4N_04945 [Thermodesulfobacteriota bacterium]